MTITTTFPQQAKATLTLNGPAGKLEVATTWPQQASPSAIIIICHPDPRQLGTMNNKVVTTISRSAGRQGLASVRFNFRGVGNSEGQFGNQTGEYDDLNCIYHWVKQAAADLPIYLAGFSFGSYIAAWFASQHPPLKLISIAPPVNHYNFEQLTKIQCPWLVIQGDQDEVVPSQQVEAWQQQMPQIIQFHTFENTGHFFHGRLIDLGKLIETFLTTTVTSSHE